MTGEGLDTAAIPSLTAGSPAAWPAGAEDGDYSILYETASQLAGMRDVTRLSQLVIERARLLLKTDLAFVALRNPEDRILHMLACVGHRTKEFMGFARPVEQGIAVYEKRPVYSADFLNDNRLSHHPDTDARIRAEGIRSVLVVPLSGREAIVGMLAVANRTVHSFSQREVLLLSELGTQAAMALDNARLYSNAVAGAADAEARRAQTELALQHLEAVQALHDSMIEAVIAGRGMAGVLAILHQAFGAGVIATDWRNAVLAHSGAEQWLDSKGRLLRSLRNRSAAERLGDELLAGDQPVVTGGSLLVRLATAAENLGSLWFPRVEAVGDQKLLVATAQRAAKVLALELIRERVAVDTERRLGRDFLLNLLSDTPADSQTLESLARQVWRRYGSAHRPVTLRLAADQPVPTAQLERARRFLTDARPGDLVAIHHGEIVLMLGEVDRGRSGEEVGRLRALLAEQGMDVSIVVGTPCRDLAEDRTCTMACIHLHELLGFRPVIWLEELEPLTILFDANDRDRLDRFVHSVLGEVAEKPQLLATLRAYYGAGRNRAKAARLLKVHVNTLRYRLERIESLVGQSLEDPAKEAAIQLAVAVKGGQEPSPAAARR